MSSQLWLKTAHGRWNRRKLLVERNNARPRARDLTRVLPRARNGPTLARIPQRLRYGMFSGHFNRASTMKRTTWQFATSLLLLVPAAARAQTGAITGQVTDGATGRPISAARVEATVAGGQTVSRGLTDETGTYRIPNLAGGTYSVFVARLGYQAQRIAGVAVAGGGTARSDVALRPAPTQLSEVVTTASRRTEKVLDAPATVSVVTQQEVNERANVTVMDHVRTLPGVDVASGGMMQANVVARGFNNIFSGALLMLTDNRFAFVPSLRVNVPYFIPETNEDIERIEVVLGPGAALYGPNSANGVMHLITRSPFTSQGTTLTLDYGERDLFRGAFRTAWAPSPKFGAKVSYQYFKAQDWEIHPKDRDSAEVVPRDLRLRRGSGQVRLDFRPWENSEVVANYGRSVAMNAVEPTGLGAGQVKDWAYDTYQLRARLGSFFGQMFINTSDAGSTFLLRTKQPIVDKSKQWVGQAQHGFSLGSRQNFIYGFDYQHTEPKTEGTINGRNENGDEITEFGGYLHSVTRISRLFEIVAAARVDSHNHVDENVFSPRVALVVKPSELQNVRLTYNRAFSQPSTNNLFLDLLAGRIPTTGTQLFGVRALGTPQSGLQFRRDCAGGLSSLCMRIPAAFGGTGAFIPATAALLYKAAVGAAASALIAGGVPASIVAYLGTLQPTSAQVSTQLRVLNPTKGTFSDVAPGDLRDIAQIIPSITQSWELGYKGLHFNRLQISWDAWIERRTNFVGPLIVETPNVFLDRATLNTYLAAQLAPVAGPAAPVLAASVAGALGGVSGSTAAKGVPLGVVNFDNTLSSAPDVILAYRNFGKLNIWGSDLAGEVLLDGGFSIGATYSLVSDDFFPRSEVGGVSDITLNATSNKASIIGKYRNEETGLSGELRGRHVSSFPVTSGVYSGVVIPSYNLVDASFAIKAVSLGGGLFSLQVNNLFDTRHKEFAGGATLGRLIISRLQYTF